MSDVIAELAALIQRMQQQPTSPNVATVNRIQAAAPYDPQKGYTDQYNTQLTPDEESKFQTWGKQEAAKRPDGRNPAQDTYDYDMRGFWKSGGQFSPNGHAGDTFKKPNHPTFSTFSKYSTPETPGGVWASTPDGKWTFTPSVYNLKMNNAGDLQQYFQTQEVGNKLVLPANSPTLQIAPQVPTTNDPISKSYQTDQKSAISPLQGAVLTKPSEVTDPKSKVP